jgi:hemerythrin
MDTHSHIVSELLKSVSREHLTIKALHYELNEVSSILNNGNASIKLLGELVSVVCTHIEHEEELMRLVRYKSTLPHNESHNEIIRFLTSMTLECQRNVSQFHYADAASVARWICEHEEEHDNPLYEFIKSSYSHICM